MSNLRRLFGPLTAALSLLIPLLALGAAPVAAQDDEDEEEPPPITLVVLVNAMTNEERENAKDEDWEVRVSLRPLSKCTPTVGHGTYDTPWIEAGTGAVAKFSLEECVYSIAAVARDASVEGDCIHPAQLAWGRQPSDGDYVDGTVLTISRPSGETTLSIRRKPDSACLQQNRTNFVIRGDDVVAALPGASADAELLALARRAAALSEFTIRVEPDPPPGTVPTPGCGRTTEFAVRGDGRPVPVVLHDAVGACPLRASIAGAAAAFQSFDERSVSFDGAGRNILVDLSRLVRLNPARIVIIQDVRGSNNRGVVTYTITRSCGDASTSAPAAREATSPLVEGRYTVHAPHAAAFGATATYPVGAASAASSATGCSVTVTMSGLPGVCSVAGGSARTLTWSAADPIENFDFEFDIGCGGAAPPSAPDPPPSSGTGDPPAQEPSGEAVVDSDLGEVRIVARKLANGKIEFGLQQRQDDASWGGRLLPSERLFPADAEFGDWLASSPLTVSVGESADALAEDVELRIVARLASAGRVEFRLQQRLDSGAWVERQAPTRRRYFPADARFDRWHHSSVIALAP